jgi:hypothetical protein
MGAEITGADWFHVGAESRSQYRVTLLPNGGTVTMELVKDTFPTLEFANNSRIELTGKAPGWLYALMAYQFVSAGASEISVSTPLLGNGQRVLIHPETAAPAFSSSEDTGQEQNWCNTEVSDEGTLVTLVIQVRRGPDTMWPFAVVLGQPPAIPATNRVVITGSGSVWMYGYLAALCARHEIGTVLIDFPRECHYLSIGKFNPGSTAKQRHPPTHARTIGIVGDPNSGKSVFSHFLYFVLRNRFPNIWMYDSDQAAGTPAWYLHMLGRGQRDDADRLRNRCKQEWNHKLEMRAAQEIRQSRNSLNLLIVDLPGGLHPKTCHSNIKAERIPPGREVIMREIDAFIIIARADNEPSFSGWENALDAHQLKDRIAGRAISTEHTAGFIQMKPGQSNVDWIIHGLDRANLTPEKLAHVHTEGILRDLTANPTIARLFPTEFDNA